MGYFWTDEGWDEKALTSAGLSINLLPQVFGIPCIWCLGSGVFGVWDLVYLVFGMVNVGWRIWNNYDCWDKH